MKEEEKQETLSPEVTLDPAQQSLADALKTAFAVLKVTMFLLLILYFCSGIFSVPKNQTAIRLRFGKYVGDGVVAEGGPYLGMPYPLEEIVVIESREKRIRLDKSFWIGINKKDEGRPFNVIKNQYAMSSLNLEKDSALLMGDGSIVHAQWVIDYVIVNPRQYAQFVGNSELAEKLVVLSVEEAIVEAALKATAEDWVKGNQIDVGIMQNIAQKVLNNLETGIEIKHLGKHNITLPVIVSRSFESVNQAVAASEQNVIDARNENIKELSSVAGTHYKLLVDLVNQYELAQSTGTAEQVAALEQKISQNIRNLQFEEGKEIGGEVAKIITNAVSYKGRIKQQVETDYAVFSAQNQQYKANPKVTKARLLEPIRERILSAKDTETFYVSPGKVKLDISRDPEILKRKNEQKLEAARRSNK